MSRFYFIIFLIAFASCRKEAALREPYFKFDNVGRQLLSEIKLNDTLKFSGSNGTIREYRVFKMEKIKQSVQDCSWNMGTCKTYYYYDFLKIYFIRTDTIPPFPNSPITASYTIQMQLSSDIDKRALPKNVQAKAVVVGGLVDFNAIPVPGPVWASSYITFPDFYQPLTFTSYSNAVKTYTEVVILKSGNNAVYIDPLYGRQYTVNEVWFDKKHGLVYFKDVFGNSWSRTN